MHACSLLYSSLSHLIQQIEELQDQLKFFAKKKNKTRCLVLVLM